MAFGRSLRTRVLTCPRFLRIQVVGTRKDAASASSEALRGKLKPANKRMGGRAVEGTGLENRQGRKSLVGSNPTPSASMTIATVCQRLLTAGGNRGQPSACCPAYFRSCPQWL